MQMSRIVMILSRRSARLQGVSPPLRRGSTCPQSVGRKLALDVERCIGCHACSVACKVENNVPLGRFRTKVYYWDTGNHPAPKRFFLPTLCMQCEDAPCLKACDRNAIERGADGIVRVLPDLCEQEGDCTRACPYAAIGCDDTDVADKCDFCSHRLDAGMEPACVETCPAEVFHFGDADDPASPYSRFMGRHGSETAVLKPEEKTLPSVVYRNHRREMEAKIPKGRLHDPYSYEIETWASLEPAFPPAARVQWPAVDPAANVTEYRALSRPPSQQESRPNRTAAPNERGDMKGVQFVKRGLAAMSTWPSARRSSWSGGRAAAQFRRANVDGQRKALRCETKRQRAR